MAMIKRFILLTVLLASLAGCKSLTQMQIEAYGKPYDPGEGLARVLGSTRIMPYYAPRPVCDKHGCYY